LPVLIKILSLRLLKNRFLGQKIIKVLAKRPISLFYSKLMSFEYPPVVDRNEKGAFIGVSPVVRQT